MLTKTQIVSSFQTQVFSVSTEDVLFHMYNDCAFRPRDGGDKAPLVCRRLTSDVTQCGPDWLFSMK